MDNLIKNICYATPAFFAKYDSAGAFAIPKHIEIIDKLLLDLCERKIKRLIINMPPRHGKTELISKYFPSWHLLNFPQKRIMLTSYSNNFAESLGKKSIEIFKRHSHKFSLCINSSSRSAKMFQIANHSGSLSAVGVGGSITGKGADILIIDDPVKNDQAVASFAQRNKLWEWFKSVAFTRLEPDGAVILVMTRWHEDDICGRIAAGELDEEWTILNLSAICESQNEYDFRQVGEALWKERFSISKLNEIKNTVGSFWFASLYQQNPVPQGGDLFKKENFRYFNTYETYYELLGEESCRIDKNSCYIFATMDLAISTNERSDYTVALIFAYTNSGEILLLDVFRTRIKASEHLELIRTIITRWKPTIIGIEAVQYQSGLVDLAIKEGIAAVKLFPDKDKFSRALPMAAKLESHKVFFANDSNWLSEFERELTSFPNAKNDDQVDAFAYINTMISNYSGAKPKSAKIQRNSKWQM